jgi:hypothetical protein
MTNAELRPWLRWLALAALVVVGISCGRDASRVGPPESGPRPQALILESSGLLSELEKAEQLILRESLSSITAYEALKLDWDKLTRDYQVASSGIVYCVPLPYTATAQIVGPEGAEMSVGPHKLTIPPGALKSYVVIRAEMPVSWSVGVRLSPEGLTFAKEPKLTLSYNHCLLPAEHRERVAYVRKDGKVLEYPTSRDRTKLAAVEAWLRHFSDYVVAW